MKPANLTPAKFATLEPGEIRLWYIPYGEKELTRFHKDVSSACSKKGKKVKIESKIALSRTLEDVGHLVIAELLAN